MEALSYFKSLPKPEALSFVYCYYCGKLPHGHPDLTYYTGTIKIVHSVLASQWWPPLYKLQQQVLWNPLHKSFSFVFIGIWSKLIRFTMNLFHLDWWKQIWIYSFFELYNAKIGKQVTNGSNALKLHIFFPKSRKNGINYASFLWAYCLILIKKIGFFALHYEMVFWYNENAFWYSFALHESTTNYPHKIYTWGILYSLFGSCENSNPFYKLFHM